MANGSIKYKHPLVEVFGFPADSMSNEANSHRNNKLCPFNNNESVCTKDKKDKPLGVCSMIHDGASTVICPVRFRENWIICQDAAKFFFSKDANWSLLKEVRIKEKTGKSAGNIDIVLVEHDEKGKILDFGAVEVQAVYVSGNIRRPFEAYMKDPSKNYDMDWSSEKNFPCPDFLSSSRKRLIPQLMYKGRILKSWGKKQAVVIDKKFYETLPMDIDETATDGDICWLVYEHLPSRDKYTLDLYKQILEGFEDSMDRIATPEIGDSGEFVKTLEKKLAGEINNYKKQYGVWAFSQALKNNFKQKIVTQPTLSKVRIPKESEL